jgi:ComF family protein
MNAVLRGVLGVLGDLIAPTRCAACDGESRRGAAFCPPCAGTLVRASNVHPESTAAFVYGGAIAQALKRFKFDDRPDLAPALLAGLGTHLDRLRGTVDLVVPVPLHPSRLVERGYNQAALLARPLARLLAIPCAPRALCRLATTERQTELTREARAANVANAFAANELRRLAGARVLLVDDVETTGATLSACRAAVMTGGARAVLSAVVARVEAVEIR